MIRLSPIWNRCNLDMADEGENGLEPPRYIAPHYLNMVEVEHQPQVWLTDFPDDIRCQFNSVQEIARSVVVVQRLDENRYFVSRRFASICEIIAECSASSRPR